MTLQAHSHLDDPGTQRTFVIELADATESVMRVLEAFALGGARLTGLDLKPILGGDLRLRVVAIGLDEVRAGRITRRLAALPIVRAIASGWMSS